MNMKKLSVGVFIGCIVGWVAGKLGWIFAYLGRIDPSKTLAVPQNKAERGEQLLHREEHEAYTIVHVIHDGIERISYLPKKRQHDTPIMMQHGMWHGAWCWQPWQELLAEWGWESHAISLPAHGLSPEQRPLPLCTLDYYLSFLKAEIDRLPRRPILMGHSMGGALTQWYLRYVGDLEAAVLVAPWTAHSVWMAGTLPAIQRDPDIVRRMVLEWDATSWVNTPDRAAKTLLSDRAVVSGAELDAQLGGESVLATYQHNPPFWKPPTDVNTPMLWLAAEKDGTLMLSAQEKSAAHYGADYVVVEAAGHNLMMEWNWRETAVSINDWLTEKAG